MLTGLMLTLLLQTQFQSPSCAAGEGWNFVVRGRDIEKSPRWNERESTPPFSPRAAVRSARAFLRQMNCKDADSWEVLEVALRPIRGEPDLWIYVIRFGEPLPIAKGSVGSVFQRVVDVPVLMSGATVPHSVGAWPPPK
jgi:hypothetical protein